MHITRIQCDRIAGEEHRSRRTVPSVVFVKPDGRGRAAGGDSAVEVIKVKLTENTGGRVARVQNDLVAIFGGGRVIELIPAAVRDRDRGIVINDGRSEKITARQRKGG